MKMRKIKCRRMQTFYVPFYSLLPIFHIFVTLHATVDKPRVLNHHPPAYEITGVNRERSYSGKAGWAHGRESLRQLKKPNRTQRWSQQINELTGLPVYISDKSFCLKPSHRRDPGSLLPDSRHNMVFPNVFKKKRTSTQITEKMCF